MNLAEFLSLDKIAKMLSGWTACDIWAMLSFGMIAREFWRNKKEFQNQEGWREIRNKQIASEVSQTEVMKHLTDEIVDLKMLITKYLIKE